jgi:hypothetical protein
MFICVRVCIMKPRKFTLYLHMKWALHIIGWEDMDWLHVDQHMFCDNSKEHSDPVTIGDFLKQPIGC